MDRLTAEQCRRNADSKDRWDVFGPHRHEVTKHLTRGFAGRSGRLCLMGAGNSNDLELPALCRTYAEVHLVDLDGAALEAGVARQQMSSHQAIHLHRSVDVTGVYGELAAWIGVAAVTDVQIDHCLGRISEFSDHGLPGPFDVVGSVCLLSQIIESAAEALGADHARFPELMLALRRRHFQLLWELVAPGGWGILVSDFVSSETCPELATIPESAFPDRMRELVERKNFFHGVNPFAMAQALREDPLLAAGIEKWQLVRPWRWHFGSRVYAVSALKFRRFGEPSVTDDRSAES